MQPTANRNWVRRIADIQLHGQHLRLGKLAGEIDGNLLQGADAPCRQHELEAAGTERANSYAVDLPMPDDAPVMRMVLPWRRLSIVEAVEEDEGGRDEGDANMLVGRRV